uniref:Catechol O-methyltransferase n=1 Tax=Solanum tuberosum TaxID=4113 RepID=M1A8M5_SOLTU
MANMSQLPISIGSDKEGNFTYAMQLLSSSVLPFVLHSTIELDVFEILAKANDTQLSSSQIVSKMACNNPIDAANMLDRMLYVLATYSLLTCSINNNNNGLYGLSPVGKMFVSDNEDGASLGPLLALLQHKVSINTCQCVKLLKNCYKATPAENGKVIVVEAILPVKPDHIHSSVVISQFDLIMLAQTPGGKERSQHEFRSLATEAGFNGINFICRVSNFWVMEFHK